MSEIENSGSTARDHLANERTFLAWVRTALGIMGLGVVIERFVETEGQRAIVAGALLISYGVGMLVYSLFRYRKVAMALERGRFPVAIRGPLMIAALSIVLGVAAYFLLFR